MHKNIRLHIITVYNPPEYVSSEKQSEIISWVEKVITEFILSVNPNEYVIMGGDFNQRRKNFRSLAMKAGLK